MKLLGFHLTPRHVALVLITLVGGAVATHFYLEWRDKEEVLAYARAPISKAEISKFLFFEKGGGYRIGDRIIKWAERPIDVSIHGYLPEDLDALLQLPSHISEHGWMKIRVAERQASWMPEDRSGDLRITLVKPDRFPELLASADGLPRDPRLDAYRKAAARQGCFAIALPETPEAREGEGYWNHSVIVRANIGMTYDTNKTFRDCLAPALWIAFGLHLTDHMMSFPNPKSEEQWLLPLKILGIIYGYGVKPGTKEKQFLRILKEKGLLGEG